MKNILIITCSLSGCTDLIADEIGKVLSNAGHHVTIEISDDATQAQIEAHDFILLGTYTYSMNTENEAFIPFELEDFLDILYKAHPEEKYFGIFGSCDATYKFFGEAVNLLQADVEKYGGNVMAEVLKIELEPDTPADRTAIEAFTNQYLKYIQ